jgi:hypothetical protein
MVQFLHRASCCTPGFDLAGLRHTNSPALNSIFIFVPALHDVFVAGRFLGAIDERLLENDI